jgi:hypothetical protein
MMDLPSRLRRGQDSTPGSPHARPAYDAALPFGGFDESGFGRELGEAGMHEYTDLS